MRDTFEVTAKHQEITGTRQRAPGEHYTLRRREPGQTPGGAWRYFTVYRSPRGGIVAGDIGRLGAYWSLLARDSELVRQLVAAVVAYERDTARQGTVRTLPEGR